MRRREREAGQSTIEFALTLMLLLSFVLFYFQLGLILGYGNYAHYATFMAARAYLSAGPTLADQKQRATDVINETLQNPHVPEQDRFPSIARGTGGAPGGMTINGPKFTPFVRHLSWAQGVRYEFRSRLFIFPLPKLLSGGGNQLDLKSESWLGREPSQEECVNQMGTNGWVYDNGC